MKKWLSEVEESLSSAQNAASNGDIPLHNLYMLAPIIYSHRKNTNNDALLQEMIDANEAMFIQDCLNDDNSKYQYKFHFVSSYLYCFVVAGKIDEFEYDNIMLYITDEFDLFIDIDHLN